MGKIIVFNQEMHTNSTNIFLLLLAIFAIFERSESICPKNAINGSSPQTCYFGVKFNASFSEGDSFCSNFYGHLASITNGFDNLNVLQLARDAFQDLNVDSVWIGGIYDGQNIQWLDGSPDIYRNFLSGAISGNMIMDLSTGKWNTASWNSKLPFVCLNQDSSSGDPPCPTEWTYVQQTKSCYKPLFDVDFQTANDACKSLGGDLASIHSEEENRVVNALLRSGTQIDGGGNYPLIGARRTGPGNGDFTWLDGSAWDYINWAAGEPDNAGNNEYCLSIIPDQLKGSKNPSESLDKWNDITCDIQHRSALCKKTAKY